jgi:adenine deaminase
MPGATAFAPLAADRAELARVARAEAPADLVLADGRVLNVFTGECVRADVGIARRRIAWVGPPRSDAKDVVSVDGAVLVPGLIEAHCHPDLVYDPWSLAESVRGSGTTTVCADLLTLLTCLSDEELLPILAALEDAPTRFAWALRPCLDGFDARELTSLSAQRLTGLMQRLPGVVSVGEVTDWRNLAGGDARLSSIVAAAEAVGLRINGHLPGASAATLGTAAAVGITDDHEAMTAGEVRDRLRQGMWVLLRHSSLRPDLPALVQELREGSLPSERLMLTTDGPVARDLLDGHLDRIVREAICAGVPPVTALQMATIRPATYLGLDAHIGSIAPGRLADIVVTPGIDDFAPSSTFLGGALVQPSALRYRAEWRAVSPRTFREADLTPRGFVELCRSGPRIHISGVMTSPMPTLVGPEANDEASDGVLAALIDREGEWCVGATLHGLHSEGLASSFNGSGDILVLGADPDACLRAYRTVIESGGAIVGGGRILELPLRGLMSDRPVADVAHDIEALSRMVAWTTGPEPPLEFLLLFLSLGVLAGLRMTPEGVLDVKARRLVSQPVRLHPIQMARTEAPMDERSLSRVGDAEG